MVPYLNVHFACLFVCVKIEILSCLQIALNINSWEINSALDNRDNILPGPKNVTFQSLEIEPTLAQTIQMHVLSTLKMNIKMSSKFFN